MLNEEERLNGTSSSIGEGLESKMSVGECEMLDSSIVVLRQLEGGGSECRF